MSAILREKSAETTQRVLVAVVRARKRPPGEGRMWEKGPLARCYEGEGLA